ncbi:epoxide hydrolase family protein [Hydrogenophaga laconesensis]|uniref:Pimeloyl-ACP methyl ester carboxylesterase n=1 Tax=Hydrogenophaga laconesensis TaxID=1805971 RepID=A0ABU1V7W9_9BURK|nr:epoxide hydrolase family protein [Hydrogenophaga laconesensis]MDR7093510.1 pimeloyl-ACP methyl ester carboxylesterase [Hydrogenophaga laconesensis]
MTQPQTFRIEVPQATLGRIAQRLKDYEWPQLPQGEPWKMGTDEAGLRALVDHWLNGFDTAAQLQRLNDQPQFRAQAGGIGLHYVHHRRTGTQGLPVMLMHGWPSSYLEYLDVAQALAADRDVVVVSLPNTGFSDKSATLMGPRAMAHAVHALMTQVLGYKRYVAHGSDWGSILASWLGNDFPEQVAGIHMSMISPRFVAGAVQGPEEQQWLAGFRERFEDDGAYFRQQTSRPHTLAFLLGDSPVGLLSWQAEKFMAWSDPEQGSASEKIATRAWKDRLVLNTLLQLVSGTAASSTLIYRGLAVEGAPGFPNGGRVNVPVAIAAMRDPAFPAPPRSLVERVYRVERWTGYAHGGHFPGYEAPDLLNADLTAFAQGL